MLNRVKGSPAGLWHWIYKPRRARRELFCACYALWGKAPRFVKYVKETKHILFSASVYLKSHVTISTCSLTAYFFFRKLQQQYKYFVQFYYILFVNLIIYNPTILHYNPKKTLWTTTFKYTKPKFFGKNFHLHSKGKIWKIRLNKKIRKISICWISNGCQPNWKFVYSVIL